MSFFKSLSSGLFTTYKVAAGFTLLASDEVRVVHANYVEPILDKASPMIEKAMQRVDNKAEFTKAINGGNLTRTITKADNKRKNYDASTSVEARAKALQQRLITEAIMAEIRAAGPALSTPQPVTIQGNAPLATAKTPRVRKPQVN